MRLLLLISFALAACSVLAQGPGARVKQTRSPVQIEFVKIAPGEFTMGCSDGDTACNDDEKPSHKVRLTKSFEIGKYEVTQTQYQAVMGANPSTIKGENRPVETVSR